MAKRELREKAISLRNAGMSYSEIKLKLKVAKSTLSVWLKDFPLSSKQIDRFKNSKNTAIEKYRNTMSIIRQKRHDYSFNLEKNSLLPLNNRDLEIGGLFLYWGEGGKTSRHQVTISNSDPSVLVFAKKWLLTVFEVPMSKIRIRLTIYENMNISKEKMFWSNLLDTPLGQFRKIQIKTSNGKSNYGFGHGTCELVVSDTRIKAKIMAGLEVMEAVFAV